MKGKFKRAKGWCDYCDRNIVAAGTKCEVCGNRNYTSKIKKPKIKPHNELD